MIKIHFYITNITIAAHMNCILINRKGRRAERRGPEIRVPKQQD